MLNHSILKATKFSLIHFKLNRILRIPSKMISRSDKEAFIKMRKRIQRDDNQIEYQTFNENQQNEEKKSNKTGKQENMNKKKPSHFEIFLISVFLTSIIKKLFPDQFETKEQKKNKSLKVDSSTKPQEEIIKTMTDTATQKRLKAFKVFEPVTFKDVIVD